MKRDWDLIRELLLEFEKRCDGDQSANSRLLEIESRSDTEIAYHISLLAEAGLIDAADRSTNTDSQWLVNRLTWDGHEFLDAARDRGRWQRAKETITSKGGGLGFDLLMEVLVTMARGAITGGTT